VPDLLETRQEPKHKAARSLAVARREVHFRAWGIKGDAKQVIIEQNQDIRAASTEHLVKQ